jgi:hypothetical protein
MASPDPTNDVTEAEAAERWCPHARNTYQSNAPNTDYAPPHNRFNGEPKEANCIGSRFMMWRWTWPQSFGRCGLAR